MIINGKWMNEPEIISLISQLTALNALFVGTITIVLLHTVLTAVLI